MEAQLVEEESLSRQGAMRRHVRAIARLLALWSVTVGIFLVGLGAEVVGFLSPSTGVWLQARGIRLWARTAATLLGMQLEVRGTPPTSPSLLVANHLSYVDIFLLATQTNALFVAKSEVADWPVIGTPVTSRASSSNGHYPVTILSHEVRDTLARRSEPPGTALRQTPSPERRSAPGDVPRT